MGQIAANGTFPVTDKSITQTTEGDSGNHLDSCQYKNNEEDFSSVAGLQAQNLN